MRMVIKAGLPAIAISLLLGLTGCGSEQEDVVLTPAQEEAVTERLMPDGEVTLESDVVAAAPAIDGAEGAAPRTAEDIYNKSCTTCHSTGAAGAPKLGDPAGWEARVAQGMDVLHTNAINGIRGMPPRGLCMDCTDDEIKATVDYMVENSK